MHYKIYNLHFDLTLRNRCTPQVVIDVIAAWADTEGKFRGDLDLHG